MRRLVAWGFGVAAVLALGTNYWRPIGVEMVTAVLAAVVNGWRKSRDAGLWLLIPSRPLASARSFHGPVVPAGTTEPDAVILTGPHAGTLRYDAGRDTIRFDVLDPAWLDRAVTWLDSRGRHPYILVEDSEHPLFSARYGRANALGHLAFTPTLRPGPELERGQRVCAAPADRTGPR